MGETKQHWHHRVRFPWRDGNKVRLLIDGHVFFPAMLEAIDGATESLELEMYLFESGAVAGQFINHLCAASQRGVRVRLLLDDFGALKLLASDRQRLMSGGVDLRFYNPLRVGKFLQNMVRDHRKLLIADGREAFVGGAGITDEFDPPMAPEKRWRETVVSVTGPVVADWRALFEHVWIGRSIRGVPVPVPEQVGGLTGRTRCRVSVGRGRLFRGIYRVLIKRIRNTRHRLWISTAYFVPSRQLRKALQAAAARGVEVRLLLPGPDTDHPRVRIAGRGLYTPLLRAGIRIFEYQPRVLHSKAVICDDWVSIGSSNYDRWNLRWNLEANLEVEHGAFSEQAEAMFAQDFRDSVEIDRDRWLRRPWRLRIAERYWGWVELWITRLGGRNWKD